KLTCQSDFDLFFLQNSSTREHPFPDLSHEESSMQNSPTRLFPPPLPPQSGDEESLDVWGFRDTKFEILNNGSVRLSGSRYSLCGQELPSLLPWVSEVMKVSVRADDQNPPAYPTAIPEPVSHPNFMAEVVKILQADQISQDPKLRLRHGHGHTQEEMFAIKYGKMARIPDLVVYPSEEEQVSSLVEAAIRHDVCLIPFGGGTSVTEALRCPENEGRFIVSVDMRRMNRILWIDPVNRMACIQAGAVGRHIFEQLKQYGFTLGHEPDSVEFSTLGGWIATNASGMKKNRYGNIEDIVLDMNVVTAAGKLERSSVAPRESAGSDPRLWLFGSEGNLGIITSAIVKLFPLPEVQRYGSVIFPTFKDGVAFLYDLTQNGAVPASIRLVDNLQFQFGLALKSKSTGLKALKSKIEKFFVINLKGFDPQKMVACTIVFEGSRAEVATQEKAVYGLAKKHKGMKAGAENGIRGYQLTFGIAYIRDFVMKHYFLAESFETSVPWSQAESLCENVKARLAAEYEKRGLPGKPFLTCRVTQVYETGVCVYFYFGYYYKGVEHPSELYAELEVIAREEILRNGGSLSHHHGIGKLRQRFLPEIKSPAMLEWIGQAKRALDPSNTFGSGNQSIAETSKTIKAVGGEK
ncbi:MAG: FAD-binding oxidoreductase, partial [Deltaproteobacteria bacterium]|nr:FAD-binding oxidoreductase [Deltaproteobacteria bacterium]